MLDATELACITGKHRLRQRGTYAADISAKTPRKSLIAAGHRRLAHYTQWIHERGRVAKCLMTDGDCVHRVAPRHVCLMALLSAITQSATGCTIAQALPGTVALLF